MLISSFLCVFQQTSSSQQYAQIRKLWFLSFLSSNKDSEFNTSIAFPTTPVQATVIFGLLQSPLPVATSTKIRNINHVTHLLTTIQWLSTELTIQTKSLTVVCKSTWWLGPCPSLWLLFSCLHMLDANHASLFLCFELSRLLLNLESLHTMSPSAYTAALSTLPMARSFRDSVIQKAATAKPI